MADRCNSAEDDIALFSSVQTNGFPSKYLFISFSAKKVNKCFLFSSTCNDSLYFCGIIVEDVIRMCTHTHLDWRVSAFNNSELYLSNTKSVRCEF